MRKLFLLFLTSIVLAGCSGGGGGGNKVLASIAISPADNRIAAGTTRQFTATGTYSDSSTQVLTTSVAWNSSDPSIATIDPISGMVTAVAAGTTTIKATSGTISGTTTVTVPPTTLVTISINPINPWIAAGTTQQFTATAIYSDSSTQNVTTSASWSSSDPSVATIDPTSGKVTAVAAGTTTIKATSGTISGTTTLTVTTLAAISINPINPTLTTGTNQQFTATGTLSGTTTTQDLTTSVFWSSSNTSVATIVDPTSGKATAVGGGTTTITATLGTISGTTTLTVPVPPATVVSIAIDPANPTITNGTTQQFTATGTLSGSNPTIDLTTSVSWSSSNTSVATIDPTSGKATAVGVGTTTISADLGGGISGSTTLTVAPFTVTETWTGTYTIYDDPGDPSQIGTYAFKFVLTQTGSAVTGVVTLRDATSPMNATGQLTGTVTGQQMNFSLTYIAPLINPPRDMTDIGTASITDSTMTGHVIENYNTAYNCSYTFILKKE